MGQMPGEGVKCPITSLDRRTLGLRQWRAHLPQMPQQRCGLFAPIVTDRARKSVDQHRSEFTVHHSLRGWLGSRVVSVLDSGAEGPGSKSQPRRCRVTVLGKLFTPIVPLSPSSESGSDPLKGCDGNCGPGGK